MGHIIGESNVLASGWSKDTSYSSPVHEMTDFVAWSPSKTGTFLVHPAYQLEWDGQFEHKFQASTARQLLMRRGIQFGVYNVQQKSEYLFGGPFTM